MRLGFLSSHGGSTARAVAAACRSGELNAVPVLVISNNSASPVLAWAREAGLETAHLSGAAFPNSR